MAPAKLQPALLGGLAMGVLSVLPIINIPNCCCLWVVFGGGLAAYLMQQNHPEPISAGDGAIVGLLAGVIGAVIWAGLSIPIGLLVGPLQGAFIERMLENASDIPPELRAMLENMRGGNGIAMGIGTIAAFFGMLVIGTGIGAVFGTIGGILGAVIFRKNVPPPPPPPVPPTMWTPPPPPPPDVPGTV